MKFMNMPAVFSLLAGLAVCIAAILSRMSLLNSLIWVFTALLIFYIIGLAVRALFNVILTERNDEVKEVIAEDEQEEFETISVEEI